MPLLALAVGMALAAVLYLKNKRQYYDKWLTAILFLLRSIAVASLVLLIINPFVTIKNRRVEQPLAVLLRDNSASVALCSDSLFYKDTLPSNVKRLKDVLSEHYEVEEYLFGDSLRLGSSCDYADKTTDLSEALSKLKRDYYKRNVGAVVLFSDGIVNRGNDVVQDLAQYPFRVHSLVMGDTTHYPDMMVKDIRANNSVSSGSTFPIQAVVSADNCRGATMTVGLEKDGRKVSEKSIEVSSDNFAREEVFLVNADKAGVHHYVVRVSGIDDEQTDDNNSRSVFVEVRPQKYKVLMMASSPHPDMAALQAVMDDNFDVGIYTSCDAAPDLSDADVLVVCGTLTSEQIESLDNQLEQYKALPLFFIFGAGTPVEQFNSLQKVFTLSEGSTNSMLDIKADYNAAFPLFSMPEAHKAKFFPPLSFPYLNIKVNRHYDAPLYQEMMGVKSSMPLLSFADDGRKMAFLFGNGVWRWRLFDFCRNGNHNTFDAIFSKTIKYLITENNQSFSVHYNEAYYGGSEVAMTAVVRNLNNEVITSSDVKLELENMTTGEKFEHDFYVDGDQYVVNLGHLPEGAYQFAAKTEAGGRKLVRNGTFFVANAGLEARFLTANAGLLLQVGTLTDGSCHNVRNMEEITSMLLDDKSISSVEYFETRYSDLISLKWIVLVIIAALTAEWLLRKLFGGY